MKQVITDREFLGRCTEIEGIFVAAIEPGEESELAADNDTVEVYTINLGTKRELLIVHGSPRVVSQRLEGERWAARDRNQFPDRCGQDRLSILEAEVSS
jgi:hypothetical protein